MYFTQKLGAIGLGLAGPDAILALISAPLTESGKWRVDEFWVTAQPCLYKARCVDAE
jgi:hypothetical protein